MPATIKRGEPLFSAEDLVFDSLKFEAMSDAELIDLMVNAKRQFVLAGGDPRNEQFTVYVDAKELARTQAAASAGDEQAQEALKIMRPIGEAKD